MNAAQRALVLDTLTRLSVLVENGLPDSYSEQMRRAVYDSRQLLTEDSDGPVYAPGARVRKHSGRSVGTVVAAGDCGVAGHVLVRWDDVMTCEASESLARFAEPVDRRVGGRSR